MGQILRFNASRTGQIQYISELRSVYGSAVQLPDPDWALANDPEVYTKVMRDPLIASALFQRFHSIAGTSGHMEPPSDSDEDKIAAGIMDELWGHVSKFVQSKYELASAILKGRSYAYLRGQRIRSSFDGGSAREWWVPKTMKDVDKRRFRWVPTRGEKVGQRIPRGQSLEFWSLDANKWLTVSEEAKRALVTMVYQDREERLGHGEGIIVPLYHFFYAKGQIWREYLQGISRWAQGYIALKLGQDRPGSVGRSNDELVDEALEVIHKMRSEHALVYGEGDEVQVFESSGTGNNMAQDALQMINEDLLRLIHGSVRPMGGDTETGARAQGEVEQETSARLVNYDRMLMDEAITETGVRLVWTMNRSNFVAQGLGKAQMPKYVTTAEVSEDPQEVATQVETLLAAGLELDKKEVFERTGWTMPEEGAETVKAPSPEPPGGGGGLPFRDDGSAFFVAQMERLAAMPEADRMAEMQMYAAPKRCPDGTIMPKSGDCTGHEAAKEDEQRPDPSKPSESEPRTGRGAAAASDEYKSSLSGQEKSAIDFYTGDGWTEVNSALRGTPDIRTGRVRELSEVETTVKGLDSAIEKAGTTDPPFRTYRGVQVDDPESFVKGIVESDGFSDSAFQSTSTDPKVASASGNVVLVMKTNKGAPLGGLSQNSQAESELLLGRGWNFKPAGEAPRQLRDGTWVIGLELSE